MYQEKCRIRENKRVAPGHFVLTMASKRISHAAKPGQFVQILCAESLDPLLPRPFSFLTTTGRDFSVLYHVIGRGTALLEKMKKGEELQVIGPLGNGFSLRPETRDQRPETKKRKRILVGGGVGIPPLYHLAKTLLKTKLSTPEEIEVYLGARNKSLLLCEKEFKKLKVSVSTATNDGSKGSKGFVTEILESRLQSLVSGLWSPRVYTCGPTPMLKAVSLLSGKYGVPCEASVEVPMACGFGACLGCAIKIKTIDDRPWTIARKKREEKAGSLSSIVYGLSSSFRYAIACCEGPVFMGDQIIWD